MIQFKDTDPKDIPDILKAEAENPDFIYFSSETEHLSVIENPDACHISIFEKTGNFVGFIILKGINSPHKSLEFCRIVITKKRFGYGRKALKFLKNYCFKELKFHRFWFDVFTDNDRAIHLYESKGFKREGEIRECILSEGKFRSLYLYSMLEEEYFQLTTDNRQPTTQ